MRYEFEQLLEAKWAGCLDEYGRRRLSELCAANPALARRVEQEEALDGMLERCGPNHAPDDLADRVLAQLEPRRSPYVAPRRTSWFGWVFRPAIGAALAFCVMAAVGIEAGLLVYKLNSGGGLFSAPSKERTGRDDRKVAYVRTGEKPSGKKTSQSTPAKKTEKAARNTQPQRAKALTADREMAAAAETRALNAPQTPPAPAAPAVQAETEAAAPPTVEFPAPGTPPAETDLEGPQLAFARPAPGAQAPAAAPNAIAPSVEPLMAAPAVTPPVPSVQGTPTVPPVQGTPAVVLPNPTIPGPRVMAKAAPTKPAPAATDALDRQVAMDIYLTPMPQPSRGGTGSSERSAVQALPPGVKTFVQPDQAQPRPQALSLKEIHYTLISIMGAGAPDITPQPVNGSKDQWEVRVSLTPDQFRRFTTELRGMGVLPGQTVVGEESGGASARTHARSYSTNHYEIRRGKQWMKPMVALAPQAGAEPRRRASEGKINVSIRIQQVGRPGAR